MGLSGCSCGLQWGGVIPLLPCFWPDLSAPSPVTPAPTANHSFRGEGAAEIVAEKRQRGALREKKRSCAMLMFPPANLLACTWKCVLK